MNLWQQLMIALFGDQKPVRVPPVKPHPTVEANPCRDGRNKEFDLEAGVFTEDMISVGRRFWWESQRSTFGRRYSPDDRDQRYLLRPPVPLKALPIMVRHWDVPKILDQGETSQCVGYSGWQYLKSCPNPSKTGFTPFDLYKGAQQHDEWPGDAYQGSSVRGLFKWMTTKGWIKEYRWGKDIETVVAHLLLEGPVVVGTDWYSDMGSTNHGYAWPSGKFKGGHAYLLSGADRNRKNPDGTKGAVRVVNSWGRNWGEAGRCWIAFHAMDHLIKAKGEACVARDNF